MTDQQDAEMKTSNESAATEQLASMSVEEVIEGSLGQMTWNQILQAVIASLGPIFDNQQTLITVFTDAQPSWHCTKSNCTSSSNICSLPRTDWAWTGHKHSTIISDWELECASSFTKGLPATSFFLGSLLSGFLIASLGDTSLGRKNLLAISVLTMSLAGLASAFSPNFWMYCAIRFICGAGRVAITICSCILLPERVGKRWRGQIVLLGFTSLTFGSLSLTAIAYLTRNSSWRTLYIWTSIPAAIYSAVTYLFLLESPRWLFMQGRQSDAIEVLKKLGSISTNSLKIDKPVPDKGNNNPFSSIKVLLRKRWAVQRLTVTMVLSFGVGMMYLGMFLGVGGLGLDIYLSSILTALIFLLSSLITYLYWIQRCNRRSSVLVFCSISGVASIVSTVGGRHYKGVHVGLEMVALFCACMVFNILFMYTVELFPTCVRNTAASLSRQALLFASIFVPVLVVIGRSNEVFCHTVFGVTILLCGSLVITLPETRGKVLCDTMEEQEVTAKNNSCFPGCI